MQQLTPILITLAIVIILFICYLARENETKGAINIVLNLIFLFTLGAIRFWIVIGIIAVIIHFIIKYW